jgi:hypothetical protein
MLSKNHMDYNDVINILYWTGRKFKPDDLTGSSVKLIGPGVFDALVSGWNYELKKYSRDLTWHVLSQHFAPNVIGSEAWNR